MTPTAKRVHQKMPVEPNPEIEHTKDQEESVPAEAVPEILSNPITVPVVDSEQPQNDSIANSNEALEEIVEEVKDEVLEEVIGKINSQKPEEIVLSTEFVTPTNELHSTKYQDTETSQQSNNIRIEETLEETVFEEPSVLDALFEPVLVDSTIEEILVDEAPAKILVDQPLKEAVTEHAPMAEAPTEAITEKARVQIVNEESPSEASIRAEEASVEAVAEDTWMEESTVEVAVEETQLAATTESEKFKMKEKDVSELDSIATKKLKKEFIEDLTQPAPSVVNSAAFKTTQPATAPVMDVNNVSTVANENNGAIVKRCCCFCGED